MHLLKEVEINNFLNLRCARLEGLRDLNMIIGPNNCGKTSLLRGIAILDRLTIGRFSDDSVECKPCKTFYNSASSLLSLAGEMKERERFLNRHNTKITYTFDAEEIERVFPYLTEDAHDLLVGPLAIKDEAKVRDRIDQLKKYPEKSRTIPNTEIERLSAPLHVREKFAEPRIIMKEKSNRQLGIEHVSFLINKKFGEEVFQTLIMCPDARLDSYKGKSVPDYLRLKNLAASEQADMVHFLKDLVDVKLTDMRQNMDLIRLVEDKRFDTTIAEQGSGVKSLICLVADILAGPQNKILLIDEPELGLNPSGKQAFLKFLLDKSNERQIFISTHDPTFVNPLLWNKQGVAVYLHSVAEKKFVRVNLKESENDPNTFAGYLPHTTSLKQIHIYVEGSLDVYIFQIFLEKFLKATFADNWYEILNRIGVYHLAGDFWSHLLYTIPDKPYFSIVILDGDKSSIAPRVIEEYDGILKNRFKFFSSVHELAKVRRTEKKPKMQMPIPVCCLLKPTIEDYLDPKPIDKKYGPIAAMQMNVPNEIAEIFSAFFRLSKIEI